jgi:hypothetical protein
MYIYKQAPLILLIDINKQLLRYYDQETDDKNLTIRADVKQYIKSAKWFSRVYDECIDIVSNL